MPPRRQTAPDPDPLIPAVFLTEAPSARHPPTHFVLCWLHRELASMTARANGEPAPVFAPMPQPPTQKGKR